MKRIFIYSWVRWSSIEDHGGSKVGSSFVFVTTSNYLKYSQSDTSAYKLPQWTFPGKGIYISANYSSQSGRVLKELNILSQQRLTHPVSLICSMNFWGRDRGVFALCKFHSSSKGILPLLFTRHCFIYFTYQQRFPLPPLLLFLPKPPFHSPPHLHHPFLVSIQMG